MATTINADNGVSSGSAGLKESADSSGVLALQTNGTTALSISTGQVVTFTNPPIGVDAFAAGTALLFYQAAAPTGWTKSTTNNDKTLRVVSGGTGGSAGGTTAFSTVFANQTPTITTSGLSAAATTLTEAQIPSHTHTVPVKTGTGGNAGTTPVTTTFVSNGTVTSNATGGGGSHTHSISGSATSSAITLNVQYIDVIVCTKN
jgi:hypothetical protein